MCVQGTLIYNRDSFLPNLRRPDCRGLSLLKGGQVLTTKGGGWFFFLSSSRSSRIYTTDCPSYLFTPINSQLQTLIRIQRQYGNFSTRQCRPHGYRRSRRKLCPIIHLEDWLMNREESTRFIIAGHLIDSNV